MDTILYWARRLLLPAQSPPRRLQWARILPILLAQVVVMGPAAACDPHQMLTLDWAVAMPLETKDKVAAKGSSLLLLLLLPLHRP